MTRSQAIPIIARRNWAALTLALMLLGNLPFEQIDRARAARGFITLTGQYTLNTEVFVLSHMAAISWSGVFALGVLYIGRSRFEMKDLGFLVGHTLTITGLSLWQLGQDLPGTGTTITASLMLLLTVAAPVFWVCRSRIIAFAVRLRIRNPFTVMPA